MASVFDFIYSVWDQANNLVKVGIQAGTALIGRVSASAETSTVYNGTTALTPKFAVIDRTSSGELVAAVTSKKIRVLAAQFTIATKGKIKFMSDGSGGSPLTGDENVSDTGGFVLPFNPAGWFETASGKNLYITLTTVTEIDGSLTYVEV